MIKRFLTKTGLMILAASLSACASQNMFESLEKAGYVMNPNFSTAYEPGTLIQTARVDREGKERPFATPVVITVAADCFPGKVPQQKDLVLPQSRGKRETSLDVGTSALASLASVLNINASLVKNYSLTFEDPQVIYFPISDIFGQLSPKCVDSLGVMQLAGNKLEWYEIIYEVVVAKSLSFKLEWTAGASIEARTAQVSDVTKKVAGWIGSKKKKQQDDSSQEDSTEEDSSQRGNHIKIVAETTKITELHADGTVVVAYRSAALKPIKP